MKEETHPSKSETAQTKLREKFIAVQSVKIPNTDELYKTKSKKQTQSNKQIKKTPKLRGTILYQLAESRKKRGMIRVCKKEKSQV